MHRDVLLSYLLTLCNTDASSIVPGGLRGLTSTLHTRELVDLLSTTGQRIDVLCSMLLLHRT